MCKQKHFSCLVNLSWRARLMLLSKADTTQPTISAAEIVKVAFSSGAGTAMGNGEIQAFQHHKSWLAGNMATYFCCQKFLEDNIYLCCREIKAQAEPQLRNTCRSKQQTAASTSMKSAQHLEIGSCCFNQNQVGPLGPSSHNPNERFQLTLDFCLSW